MFRSLSFQNVSSPELLVKLKNLATEERKITVEILWHLREVERRRLYAEIGYPSLFEYCLKELQYSESAAFRRISAMRALRENPEIESSIQSGELTVTAVAKMQTFFKSEKNLRGKIYSSNQRLELFESIKGKSTKEIERKLCAISPASQIRSQERVISATETEIRFVADNVLLRKLKTVRDLYSHHLKDSSSYAELIELLCDDILKVNQGKVKQEALKNDQVRVEKGQKPVLNNGEKHSVALTEVESRKVQKLASEYENERAIAKANKNANAENIERLVLNAKPAIHNRYIPKRIKQAVLRKSDFSCTFVDPISKRRCSSKFKLQFEHIVPVAKGGSSRDLSNLTVLCATHQQLSAIKAYGVKKMTKYIHSLKLNEH